MENQKNEEFEEDNIIGMLSGSSSVDYSDGEEEEEGEEQEREEGESQTSKATEKEGVIGEKTAEKEAIMFVKMTNSIVSRACSLYSGANRENYKIDKAEEAELVEAATAWFMAENIKMSPTKVFLATFLAIFSYNFAKAEEDRKAAIETKKTKQAFAKQAVGETTKEDEKIIEKAKVSLIRKQFMIDQNGFYLRSEKGGYLKKAENREKAPAMIIDLITEMKEKGLNEAAINEACRKKLLGE